MEHIRFEKLELLLKVTISRIYYIHVRSIWLDARIIRM